MISGTTFKSRDRAKQLIDFENMVDGSIHPTDIDGVIEYKDQLYIWYELKYKDKELPLGQRILFQRLVDDANKINKYAIAIIAEHYVTDAQTDIDLSECMVREVYHNHKWQTPKYPMNVKEATEVFYEAIRRKNGRT